MELIKIETKVYKVRGQQVMLDFDLSEMYHVENRALKQAVKRNIDRFPDDFMPACRSGRFQLTKKEWQEVITVCDKATRYG